jgi:hypothetical protein
MIPAIYHSDAPADPLVTEHQDYGHFVSVRRSQLGQWRKGRPHFGEDMRDDVRDDPTERDEVADEEGAE